MKGFALFLTLLSLANYSVGSEISSVRNSKLNANDEHMDMTSPLRRKRSDDVNPEELLVTVQQQAALLQTLQAELASTKSSQQAELTSTKNSLQTLQASFAAQQSTLNNVQTSLSSIQNKASHAVAFTVRISANRDNGGDGLHLSSHETIIFDDVVTNIGGGYNANTGIFTASLAGTYVFFMVQMAPNTHNDIYTAIVKNGNLINRVHAHGNDIYQQGSSEVTVHLAAGDAVWVRQDYGDSIRGDYWTVFTGFLLHVD